MLVSPNVTLRYINEAGHNLAFNFFSDFVIEKCEEQLPNQIFSIKQGGVHGKFFTGMSTDERHIRLIGTVRPGLTSTAALVSLQRVFNPTISGILHYENRLMPRLSKSIPCRLEELPQVYWNRGLRFDIVLTSLEAFWRGQGVTEVIAETQKMMRFPIVIPGGGAAFGVRRSGLDSIFENAGNVESGFEVTFRAKGGTVTNPEIYNVNTGKRIRINYTMQANDTITVINQLQEKRVFVNGENGFRFLDSPNTNFFLIDVGENRIGFRADENVSNLSVMIRYIPNFTFAEG